MPTAKKSKSTIEFRPAGPDELQIDLDRPRARIPERLIRLLREHVTVRAIKYSRSKSGNTHVTIRLKPFWRMNVYGSEFCDCGYTIARIEKLFLQAALGSDPMRELLSWGRARNGCPYPTLFFEDKK